MRLDITLATAQQAPPDDSEEWQYVVEFGLRVETGAVSALDCLCEEALGSLPVPSGLSRVRLSGRDLPADHQIDTNDASGHYCLQMWPTAKSLGYTLIKPGGFLEG